MLCLISVQHRDVANLVTGIGVAVRFGDQCLLSESCGQCSASWAALRSDDVRLERVVLERG